MVNKKKVKFKNHQELSKYDKRNYDGCEEFVVKDESVEKEI